MFKRIAIICLLILLIFTGRCWALQNLSVSTLTEMAGLYVRGSFYYRAFSDGDVCFVFRGGSYRDYDVYTFDEDSGETEDGIYCVTPDYLSYGRAYTGDGRWIRTSSSVSSGVYYPNHAAADQGVTGSNDTVKYYVDTVGSEAGTIKLRHNSGDPNTVYTFSTAEICPNNITLEVEPGAIIAGTLTINGIFYATGKCFASDATITFGSTAGVEVNAKWFGMSTVASATNNTTYFHKAVDSMPMYSTLIVPYGVYDITNTVFDPPNWCILDCRGALFRASDSTGTVFTIGESGATPGNKDYYEIKGLGVYDATPDWTTDRIGIKIVNQRYGKFHIDYVRGFEKGICLLGTNSKACTYNSITLGQIYNSKFNIYITADTSGWVNQNVFYNGDVGWTGSNHGGSGGFDNARAVYVDYYAINEIENISFYNTSFEGSTDPNSFGQAKAAYVDAKNVNFYSLYHGLKDWATAQSVTTLTQTAGTATCTVSGHNYDTGDKVLISGANQYEYNDEFIITVTDANIFTFTVNSNATSPATGTITAANSKFPFEFGSNSEYCVIYAGSQLSDNDIEDSGYNNSFFYKSYSDGVIGWYSEMKGIRNWTKARAYLDPNTTQDNLVNDTATQVLLDVESYDHACFSSNEYYVPVTGYYHISAAVQFINLVADKAYEAVIYNRAGTAVAKSIVCNGAYTDAITAVINTVQYFAMDDQIILKAISRSDDDTVDIQGGSEATYMEIYQISGY